MYGEILRALLNKPVHSEHDVRVFAFRIAAICFVLAMAADAVLQIIAFGGWLDLARGWAITTGVIAVVAYPVGIYLGNTRLDHHRVKTKLIEQGLADSLTGLRNRASLPVDYDAGADNARLLILLSLDRFKTVNERFGHLAGDRVLIRAARLIAEELGNLGTIYRTDGTEFTVLATGVAVVEARSQVLALLARFEGTNFGTLEKPIGLTLSAGIAAAPAGTAFAEAFAATDTALGQAKMTGRSRVCLASEPATAGIVEGDEVMWSADLPPAPRRRKASRA